MPFTENLCYCFVMGKRWLWLGLMILLIAASGFLIYQHQQNSNKKRANSSNQYLQPDSSGNCPTGYVNYGQPLGCVTQQQYQDCQSVRFGCPK